MSGSRSKRMTKKQKQMLVEYLEQNKELMVSDMNPLLVNYVQKKWEKLAELLNDEDVGGCKKTVKQWKVTLKEFKCHTKRKGRELKLASAITGELPKEKDLTEIEERFYSLISSMDGVGWSDLDISAAQNITNGFDSLLPNVSGINHVKNEMESSYNSNNVPINLATYNIINSTPKNEIGSDFTISNNPINLSNSNHLVNNTSPYRLNNSETCSTNKIKEEIISTPSIIEPKVILEVTETPVVTQAVENTKNILRQRQRRRYQSNSDYLLREIIRSNRNIASSLRLLARSMELIAKQWR